MLLLTLQLLLLTITLAEGGTTNNKDLRRWESTGIVNCTQFEFICKDKKLIIPLSQRCDGEKQCKDGSDEKKCTECRTPFSIKSSDGFLNCTTATQMRTEKSERERNSWMYTYRSEMYPKCDEDSERAKLWKNWTYGCAAGEYRCSDESMCLPARSVCDGVNDCRQTIRYEETTTSSSSCWYRSSCLSTVYEQPDELNCTECSGGAKICEANGKCIASSNVCDGYKDCPDGSDEQNCTQSLRCAACSGTKALCGNSKCIEGSKVCDGVIDCDDGSDEKNCLRSCGAPVNGTSKLSKTVKCGENRYLQSEVCSGSVPSECNDHCPSGECDCRVAYKCRYSERCISKAKVCDGKRDCAYGEDEENCLKACLKYPFFTRVNKQKAKCISMDHVCDGVFDFVDGSDEKKCDKCPSDSHRCDGGCRPSSARCDGVKDCKDGSDEKNCTCEECLSNSLNTYSCEKTRTCLKRSNACRGSTSRCPKPTTRDHDFCKREALRPKS